MPEQILFYIVVFLTNIIQTITGFAGTMLAMPASMLLVGVNEAKAVLNVMGLLSCLWLTIRNYRQLNRREFVKITALMFLGMLAGLALFRVAPLNLLLNAYAVLIIGIALKKLLVKREIQVPQRLMVLVILAAGLVHGIFVSGGSLLVIYAVAVLPGKSEFRATLSPVWVLLNGYLMVNHILAGYFTPAVTQMTLVCIVPLAAAIIIGNKLHDKINQQTFLKLTYVLLLISGILLII